MVGMLQIITYMLAFYLVVKGCEVLMTALASSREGRGDLIAFGALVLVACLIAAMVFVGWQQDQAASIGSSALDRFRSFR